MFHLVKTYKNSQISCLAMDKKEVQISNKDYRNAVTPDSHPGSMSIIDLDLSLYRH